MQRRAWLFAATILVFACGGSSSNQSNGRAPQGGPGPYGQSGPYAQGAPPAYGPPPAYGAPRGAGVGRCGVNLYRVPEYPPGCQQVFDTNCCQVEQLCARDPACVQLVDCINACPSPRTDGCVAACSQVAPMSATMALKASSPCGKGLNFTGQTGVTCAWPSGDGH